MEVEKNIAVIDGDSCIFSIFHPNKVLDDKGEPIKENNKFVYKEKTLDEIIFSADNLMNDILTKSNATHYILYIKGHNTIKDRLLVNPKYKQNRETGSPKFWNFVKEYLKLNWGAVEVNNMEVDDYVNITRLSLPGAYIVAIDGDLLGLQTFSKNHFNWRKHEWIEVTQEQAEYKFWSDMICGQKGDNLDGLVGKGEKYVEKLFNFHSNTLIGSSLKSHHNLVLNEYISHYKSEELGIKEFYKMYNSLKILDKKEGFIIPASIEYNKIDSKEVSEDNKFEIIL